MLFSGLLPDFRDWKSIVFSILEKQDPHQYIDIYRKSQMMSTKCQYQAAASNPKWWFDVKWNLISRRRQTVRKDEPMMTCKPWNPVATKKVEP